MTKYKNLEEKFCKELAEKIAHFADAPERAIQFLLRVGIITDRTMLRFMTISTYKKRLKASRTKQRLRGCKMLAIHETINTVPVSEATARTTIKDANIIFNPSLFL